MAQDKHWSFDRRVSMGHVFSTVGLVIGLAVGANAFDNRLLQVEAEQAHIREIQNIQVKNLSDKIDALGEKIDDVAELLRNRGE